MLNNVLMETAPSHCCYSASWVALHQFLGAQNSHSCSSSYKKLFLKQPDFPSFRSAHPISDLSSKAEVSSVVSAFSYSWAACNYMASLIMLATALWCAPEVIYFFSQILAKVRIWDEMTFKIHSSSTAQTSFFAFYFFPGYPLLKQILQDSQGTFSPCKRARPTWETSSAQQQSGHAPSSILLGGNVAFNYTLVLAWGKLLLVSLCL